MSKIIGIHVTLTTAGGRLDGTDDHLYLGVVGTVGGREFALDVLGFNDFEEGTRVSYLIGKTTTTGLSGKIPETASIALAEMIICLPNVTHVYLRKQGNLTPDGDDAWRLSSASVMLMATDATRLFEETGPTTLGNEHGLQLWLAESVGGGRYRNTRIPVEGDVADCAKER